MLTVIRSPHFEGNQIFESLKISSSKPCDVHIDEKLGALKILLDFSQQHVVRLSHLRDDIESLLGPERISLFFEGDEEVVQALDAINDHVYYHFYVLVRDQTIPRGRAMVEYFDSREG